MTPARSHFGNRLGAHFQIGQRYDGNHPAEPFCRRRSLACERSRGLALSDFSTDAAVSVRNEAPNALQDRRARALAPDIETPVSQQDQPCDTITTAEASPAAIRPCPRVVQRRPERLKVMIVGSLAGSAMS